MTQEEIIQLKIKIIAACKEHQFITIANLKREMDEHQQMANDYGPPKDRYDAFRSQMLRRRDIFAEQMQKANEELIVLDKIKSDDYTWRNCLLLTSSCSNSSRRKEKITYWKTNV